MERKRGLAQEPSAAKFPGLCLFACLFVFLFALFYIVFFGFIYFLCLVFVCLFYLFCLFICLLVCLFDCFFCFCLFVCLFVCFLPYVFPKCTYEHVCFTPFSWHPPTWPNDQNHGLNGFYNSWSLTLRPRWVFRALLVPGGRY